MFTYIKTLLILSLSLSKIVLTAMEIIKSFEISIFDLYFYINIILSTACIFYIDWKIKVFVIEVALL